MRIGVLFSGGGRTLQNLIDHIAQGTLAAEITCAMSSKPEVRGLSRAAEAGIPSHTVARNATPDPEFHESIARHLTAANVELVCMAGLTCMWKIPPPFEGRVINIHPALLPRFGGQGYYGKKVHSAVLESGAKKSGCTVHYCDNEYDHGPIILQRETPILPGDTPDSLAARVFEQECIAYPIAIQTITPTIRSLQM